jgi:hypothetical protein
MTVDELHVVVDAAPAGTCVVYHAGPHLGDVADVARAARDLYRAGVVELVQGRGEDGAFRYAVVKRAAVRPPMLTSGGEWRAEGHGTLSAKQAEMTEGRARND